MSVTFAEDLVDIIEYDVNEIIRQQKKETYRKIRQQQKNKSTHVIRNILYKHLPTEEEYVERRTTVPSKIGIKFIKGFIGSVTDDMRTLYNDFQNNRKISYSIHENDFGMVTVCVEFKGFTGQKFFKTYMSSGTLFDDMFKSEYKSKMFVINTVRKVFEDNDIM